MPAQSCWAKCLTARILAHARRNACNASAKHGESAVHSDVDVDADVLVVGPKCHDPVISTAPMQRRKTSRLVIDTIDSSGNPILPKRVRAIVPRLKSFLDGYWQLSVTEQDLAARESLHARALALADVWMGSPGDTSMDDTTLLSHWQAHHWHTCPHGDTWHAQWISFDVSGHHNLHPGSLQEEHIAIYENNGAPSYEVRSLPRVHQETLLQCQVGLAPAGHAEGLETLPLKVLPVPVPAHMCFSSGDVSSDSWESFLLLLSERASLLEEQNMFPNKLQHGDRVIHGMTLQRAVQLVAIPTVSEIARHIYNTETHGPDAQLQNIVNRWGIKTLSALCDFHDDASQRGRIEHVCAHALKLA